MTLLFFFFFMTLLLTQCHGSPGRDVGTWHSSWCTASLFSLTLGLLSYFFHNGKSSLPSSGPPTPPEQMYIPILLAVYLSQPGRDFPGGTVVKDLPANAGDMGSSPGLGRSHTLWSS